jgi:hypothetical protein
MYHGINIRCQMNTTEVAVQPRIEATETLPTVTGDAFEDGLSAVVGVLPTITCPLDPAVADDNDGELPRFSLEP